MLNLFKRLVTEEDGQGMVEYALIIALVAIAVMVFLSPMASAIGEKFDDITSGLGGTPHTP